MPETMQIKNEMPIITIKEFDWDWFESLEVQKGSVGNQGTKSFYRYMDCITAFDIETTHIRIYHKKYITEEQYNQLDVKEQETVEHASIMYNWQWQFDNKFTVMGRTWEEFNELHRRIEAVLGDRRRLVCFVHNLSYEFQFLKGITDLSEGQIFAVDKRKILRVLTKGGIEFRCSYLHSNMSLKVYLEKFKAIHQKLSGNDFNYDKQRFSWTPLTPLEMEYCQNDVLGLVEAVKNEMEFDQDTIRSFPLTSTGYVRRDTKKALKPYRRQIQQMCPDLPLYKNLRKAFRGGDTHASRFYAGIVLPDVKSCDRVSSYPDVMMNCKFPMTKFFHVTDRQDLNIDYVLNLIYRREKAVLMRIALKDVHLRNPYHGCPYLSESKCEEVEYPGMTRMLNVDNGRILNAIYLETTITDVDFKILLEEYDYSEIIIKDLYFANYGLLPEPFRDLIRSYFEMKTNLKDVPGMELHYMKSKNKINSLYGMCAQDPVKFTLLFINFLLEEDESENEEEILLKNNSRAFLAYQWGVWTTAWARFRLHEMINIVGDCFVYCDTDSVKYVGNFEKQIKDYNKQRLSDSKKSGAFAKRPDGKIEYMGIYEVDGDYSEFKTLGSKKYVYRKRKDHKLVVTISGVVKNKGAKELEEHGGIAAFHEDFTFVDAGGNDVIYHDFPETDSVMIENQVVEITSNAVFIDSTYTLGITKDYERLLEHSQKMLDILKIFD